MIRSSAHTLAFANSGKQSALSGLVSEYRVVLQNVIDHAWEFGIPEFDFDVSNNRKLDMRALLPTSYLKQFDTWLSARMKQAVGKQALMMINAATKKRKKQLYMLRKLQGAGADTSKLQSKIDRQPLIRPYAGNAKLELDGRFVDFCGSGGFIFVRLTSIGDRLQIKIPVKRTKVYNKWAKKGVRKASIRLSGDTLWMLFDAEEPPKSGTEVVGADQGVLTALTMSNGSTTQCCNHGHSLKTIQATLSRRKSGSKGFGKAQEQRKNYINWSLNQLDFRSIREVRLEKIYQLRSNRRSSRNLSHWRYTLIKDKLVRLGEEKGFLLTEVSNEFRSQRCSSCGFVRKANRRGKTFCCKNCGFTEDADLNAATNLKLDLFEIPYWVRLKKINRYGFFWKHNGLFSDCQERIVPDTTKTNTCSRIQCVLRL